MSGWVKIHRKITDWEWYHDINVRLVFLHLMLKANFKDKRWHGTIVQRGQLVTSIGHLATEIGITNQQTRTALEKLKSTGEITIKTTNKFTLVTIENYTLYQDTTDEDNKQNNKQITNEQQTNNKQITTTKESNKDKTVKNKDLVRFCENDLLNDAMKDFAEFRKQIKKPLGEKAAALILGKLSELSPDIETQIKIINQSIMLDWQGVFPLDAQRSSDARTKKTGFHNLPERDLEPNLDELLRQKGRGK